MTYVAGYIAWQREAAIAERLDERFRSLTLGPRYVPAHLECRA